jgi:uncharacterized protein YifE (UPF0438 family)
MTDCGNIRDSLPFEPMKLVNFPYYLSEEEHAEIVKWGAHATGLTKGSIAPISQNERVFTEVAKGLRPPETRFQRLWLRYLQAVDMETKLADAYANANCNVNPSYAVQPFVGGPQLTKSPSSLGISQAGNDELPTISNSIFERGSRKTIQPSDLEPDLEIPEAYHRVTAHTESAGRKAWEEREGRWRGYGNREGSSKDEFTPNGLFTCQTCRGAGRYADGRWCLTCDGKGTVRR